ncbi:DUF3021 domain-containing protein [Mediterraneibacter agrestimuris]|uniref:DUF3021 domain-containing protein n=1 Tax=Mediterraneibacter agrestimuris TaxID=2941333 RepID=UPI00203C09F0|nr:DUF3021 domain-containing protein [Mediterraneibacter agrestimuris]
MNNRWSQFLSREIAIEYKASIYSICVTFYYYIYQIIQHSLKANILYLMEIVFVCYLMGYVQVYLLQNFDEADSLGKKEVVKIIICSTLYTAISQILQWFDSCWINTVVFWGYIFSCYTCIFLINKLKRKIDTKRLNFLLDNYKKQGGIKNEEINNER